MDNVAQLVLLALIAAVEFAKLVLVRVHKDRLNAVANALPLEIAFVEIAQLLAQVLSAVVTMSVSTGALMNPTAELVEINVPVDLDAAMAFVLIFLPQAIVARVEQFVMLLPIQ